MYIHIHTYIYICFPLRILHTDARGVCECVCVCVRERELLARSGIAYVYMYVYARTHKHTYTQCTYLYIYTRTHTNTNTLMYTHTGCRERLLARSGFRRPHQVDLLSGTPLMSDSLRGVIARLPRCRNIQPMIAPSPSRFALGHPLNE